MKNSKIILLLILSLISLFFSGCGDVANDMEKDWDFVEMSQDSNVSVVEMSSDSNVSIDDIDVTPSKTDSIDSLQIWLGTEGNNTNNKYAKIYGWYTDEVEQHPWEPNCYGDLLSNYGYPDSDLQIEVMSLTIYSDLDVYYDIISDLDSIQSEASTLCAR